MNHLLLILLGGPVAIGGPLCLAIVLCERHANASAAAIRAEYGEPVAEWTAGSLAEAARRRWPELTADPRPTPTVRTKELTR